MAALTPPEIRVLAAGLDPIVPAHATLAALKSPWVLQPVYPDFSILSPSWLWIMMPNLFVAAVLGVRALSGGSMLRVRRVPAWRSATAGVEVATGGRVGDDARGAASTTSATPPTSSTIVEQYLYRPPRRPTLAVARLAERLQSGRLDAYLAYMLISLVAALALVAALT